jgi:hypothetical protein
MQQWIRNRSVPENAARLVIGLADNPATNTPIHPAIGV